MKIMLRAAMMALSISTIGAAYASDSQGQAGGYVYPDYVFPGSVNAAVRLRCRRSRAVRRSTPSSPAVRTRAPTCSRRPRAATANPSVTA